VLSPKVEARMNAAEPLIEAWAEGYSGKAGSGMNLYFWRFRADDGQLGNDLRIHSSSAPKASTMSAPGRIVNSEGCGARGSR